MAEEPHSWTRLRARRTTIDPGVGLAAKVADPLWLLCRQLQLAELTGDDGATPTAITVTASWAPFTHWRPGPPASDGPWLRYDRDRPLETLVEDDRAVAGAQAPPLLATVEAGARLARRLREKLPDLAAHPDLPRVTEPARPSPVASHVHRDRTIDGFVARARLSRLRTALSDDLSAADKAALVAVLEEWVSWFDRRFGAPGNPSSWVDERLEYQFALAAPNPRGGDPLVFGAPEYLGGGVLWSELDLLEGVAPPPDLPDGEVVSFEETRRFPQSLRWPGMPVDRFWEMEDGAVDLGTLSLDPADLPGLLALDMAATGSTDWFVTELALPAAGVACIDTITVSDTFGRVTPVVDLLAEGVGPDGEIGQLFAPSGAGRSDPGWFVLAPRLGARVDGPVREEVLLVRDELANLGWIIERTGAGEDGEPGDLPFAPPVQPPPSTDGTLAYRLSSGAPKHWLPLLPRTRETDQGERRELARGRVFGEDDLTLTSTMLARTLTSVLDEEVPREGKRLRRAWQYARWYDGSRHLWSGRGVGAGRGEANSALRFDDTY